MCEQTAQTLGAVIHGGCLAVVVSLPRESNNLLGGQGTRVGSHGAECVNDHPSAQTRSVLQIT